MAAEEIFIPDSVGAAKDCITIGPVPPWVRSLELDTTFDPQESEHTTELLVSRQIHAELGQISYHSAFRLKTIHAVQRNSQWPLEFDPRIQKIVFRFFKIRRGEAEFDQLNLANARVLNREQGLERYVIDGQFTWLLLLEDVRPGDILEWSFTIATRERLLPDNCDHFWASSLAVPAARIYLSILYNPVRAMKWTSSSPPMAPVAGMRDGLMLWEWDEVNVPAIKQEPGTPSWYIDYSWVQVSDCRDWNCVATAVSQVFAVEEASILDEIVKGICDAESDLLRRVGKAIDFVQIECRYLSLEFGKGGRVPAQPGVVARRRYGDCKDLSLLLTQLLKRLGVSARPILVHSGLRRSIASMLPSPSCFNHAIVEFTVEGQKRWIDPTIREQGGGALGRFVPPYGLGLPVDETATELASAPPSQNHEALYELKESILLDTSGGGSLLGVVLTTRGVHADALRAQFALQGAELFGKDRLQACANRFGRAARVGDLQYRDDRDSNEFCVAETYEISGFLRQHNRQPYCSFVLHPAYNPCMPAVPKEGPRRTPFALSFPCNVSYALEIEAPRLQATQSPPRLRWVNSFIKFTGITRVINGSWEMTTNLSTAADSVPPDQVESHRKMAETIWREAERVITVSTGHVRPKRARLLGRLPVQRKSPGTPAPLPQPPEIKEERLPAKEANPAPEAPDTSVANASAAPAPIEAQPELTPEAAPVSRSSSSSDRHRRRRRGSLLASPAAIVFMILAGLLVLMALLAPSRGSSPRRPNKPATDREITERLRQAAERGDPKAQDAYGFALIRGRGVDPDPITAIQWFRKAAAQGFANAEFNLGVAYEGGLGISKDREEAVQWYRRAAGQGFPQAQVNLARAYMQGAGVAKDPAEGVKWFQKAAEQGFPAAQFYLGAAYLFGNGIANDDVQAVKWLHKAAEQGYGEAQYNLSVCYARGRGTPRDLVESYAWLKLCSQSRTNGLSMLEKLDAELSPDEAAAARRRAEELLEQIGKRRDLRP